MKKDPKAYTLDQIADLYELLPWQREVLTAMVRRDEIAKAEKDSYRARVEAEYERICRWIETEFGKFDAGSTMAP